jgi:hypothetical protein
LNNQSLYSALFKTPTEHHLSLKTNSQSDNRTTSHIDLLREDTTYMETIQTSQDTLKPDKHIKDSSGNIIQDPSQLAEFIKDFFPDYQLEDVMSSPAKSQQQPQHNDVGLPSPPMSKPPSPTPPPSTRSNTPTEERPCGNLVSNDDPFREYFEEKVSTSQWSCLNSTRPPPPTYSKVLPAKHKLLQQADNKITAKKVSHFTKATIPASKQEKLNEV